MSLYASCRLCYVYRVHYLADLLLVNFPYASLIYGLAFVSATLPLDE